MDRDTHAPFGPAATLEPVRGQNVVAAALIGVAVSAGLVAFGLASGLFANVCRDSFAQQYISTTQPVAADPLNKPGQFQGWGRPEVAILLSGEQHGYLQPCGCSSPQYGGLARRYNLIQALRQRGWPIVAVDLGDLNQKAGPSGLSNIQGTLKYEYAMKSLDAMGYTAVNFGEYEMRMPLGTALALYALNNPTPRVVSANLLEFAPNQKPIGMVSELDIAAKHAGPKVGVFGLTAWSVEIDPNTKAPIDPGVKFDNNTAAVLFRSLNGLKAKGAELFVLLYQGNTKEAKALADHVVAQNQQNPKFPLIDVILCVSGNPEPPAQPIIVNEHTMIVEVGHKGKYVGVVGAFRPNPKGPFQLKYQMVCVGPEFETPKGQEKSNPVMGLQEDYTLDLKNGNYLAKYKQTKHPVQVNFPGAEYVGSAKCKMCHEDAYKVWQGSNHSHAYKTLVDAKNPSLRQHDGECIVCHTVGFSYNTGFENENNTKFLTDVGCESCHGPASLHVARPKDKDMRVALNPNKFRAAPGAPPETPAAHQLRINKISDSCMKCHDPENDVHFDVTKAWPKIVHMTPAAAGNPQVQAGPK
ncbi:MAG TPA: multiheme c-type cytochrome [Gemmataceae bacterium]|nr:multiheme c-type cytochrome [Gemmataceae bacterium]